LICKDGVIRREDLHFQISRVSPKPVPGVHDSYAEMTLKELERQHISYIFHKEKWKGRPGCGKAGNPRSSL